MRWFGIYVSILFSLFSCFIFIYEASATPSEHLVNGQPSGWCYPLDDLCDSNNQNCKKPIENATFGFMSYNNASYPYHYGQDFTKSHALGYEYQPNDPVYAMQSGEIIRIRRSQAYGGGSPCDSDYNSMVVKYQYIDKDGFPDSVYVFYGHIKNIKESANLAHQQCPNDAKALCVKIPVQKGNKIAELNDPSCAGWVPHLHLAVMPDTLPDSNPISSSDYFDGYNDSQTKNGRVRPFDLWDNTNGGIWSKDWVASNGIQDPKNSDEVFFDSYQPYQSPPIIQTGWLPDTGQTKCYDNTKEIPCPSQGEAFYGQDAQYATNPMSFTKLDSNGNPLPDSAASWDMVKDNNTGLIWQESDDQNGTSGSPSLYTWQEAVDYCESLPLADHHWRLPSRRELISIVDYGSFRPVINRTFFPDCQSFGYWSNDDHAHFPGHQWFVSFYDGYVYWYIDRRNLVRCVRGDTLPSSSYVDNGNGTVTDTSTGLMWQQSDDGIQRNWQQALDYCESLPLAEHSDWRLPNIRELDSIVDYTRYNPSIDSVFGSHPKSNFTYWSSTSSQLDLSSARRVSFYDGDEYWNSRSNFYYTRCVRSNTSTISPSPNYTTAQETHSQIDANETHWWDFINNKFQKLLIILGFNTQTSLQSNHLAALTGEQATIFNIKIYKPDGSLYQETQSSFSPIQVQIPNAAPGQWRFEITAIETPYPDEPYVLAIGTKDKAAATPAVLQLLLD